MLGEVAGGSCAHYTLKIETSENNSLRNESPPLEYRTLQSVKFLIILVVFFVVVCFFFCCKNNAHKIQSPIWTNFNAATSSILGGRGDASLEVYNRSSKSGRVTSLSRDRFLFPAGEGFCRHGCSYLVSLFKCHAIGQNWWNSISDAFVYLRQSHFCCCCCCCVCVFARVASICNVYSLSFASHCLPIVL